MKVHSMGWHLVRAVLFLAIAAGAYFLGRSLMDSLAPNAEAARFWVGVAWVLSAGALAWVGLCHLLQPVIRVIGMHFISVALLVFWGGVLLYFYQSGRVTQYLPDDGLFRPLMLAGGIGMAILGAFNLLMGKSKGNACCGHEHDHGHNHEGCAHDHAHEGCGHEHPHHHHHAHGHECGHGHAHDHLHHEHEHPHAHEHPHECCGHDHGHAHASVCHGEDLTHAHHDHDHGAHDHAHGILSSPRWFNQSSAVLVLLAPLALAAAYTPDQFSAKAVMNKNLYNQTYGVGARADQFSLRTSDSKDKLPPAKPATANAAPAVVDMPPPADDSRKVPGAPGVATAEAIAKAPEKPTGAAAAQSYGSFTLADLEAQVPRNKNGNFELNVPEIYYTAGDAEVQKAIAGQPIETVAQVLPEKVNNEDGHRLRVFRLLVQCCAADARPYSVPVDFGKKAPEFKDMTWVRVTGTLTFPKEGDQIVPVIQAKNIEETTAPADAMLY